MIIELKVNTYFIDEPFILLQKILPQCQGSPKLLVIRHMQLQTQIDGSGVLGYRLAAFDHADLFTAVSVINSDHNGTFGLISQARMAIVFRTEEFEDHTGLERISF